MLNKDILNANIERKATRQGFGDALLKLGENKDIVVLTGDLKDSTKVTQFAETFPNKFIDVGVAEQNMVGIATGLALSGKIPVATSYASFSPGRNWEQIRLAAYSKANIKIISTHSGFSASRDGATHQGLEDISLMRTLPSMTVLVAADYFQAQRELEQAVRIKGPVYLRLTRDDTPVFTTSKTSFEIGKAQVLTEGTDLTIIACGPIVYEALLAANELSKKDRISVEVINMHTIKPLDTKTILGSAKKTKKVITIEEHQIIGGLGSAVAEFLAEELPTNVYRMGAKDTFGESGLHHELLDKYELSAKHIVKKAKKVCAM